MAKNDLILLDSIIDKYVAESKHTTDCGEVFEFFATEQILKDYAFTEQQLLSGSVDGRNDGGIDEFFVLVNGHLAESIPEEFWPRSNSELEIYIISCKHDDSFKQSPITAMIPSLLQLFDFSISASKLEEQYNSKLLKKRDLLLTTDKIQRDIEDVLKSHGIYYDRRSNYYKNQGMSQEDIIDPLALAAGYICLIYKSPFKATGLKQRFMRDDIKYQKVFSPETNLNVWYPIVRLLKKTDQALLELKSNVKAVRFQKNYRQIILFATISRLMGTFAFGEKQLIDFDFNQYTGDEIKKTVADLVEIDETCFERVRKLPENFYEKLFVHIANKYSIKAIQSIAAKNRQLWSGEQTLPSYGLTNELVNEIAHLLPEQPWPAKVHKQIAASLNLKEMVVQNAISYLIYTGKAYRQVYGYVFDSSGNIINEGEHFGYTVEDARKKLEEQKLQNEMRFGVGAF